MILKFTPPPAFVNTSFSVSWHWASGLALVKRSEYSPFSEYSLFFRIFSYSEYSLFFRIFFLFPNILSFSEYSLFFRIFSLFSNILSFSEYSLFFRIFSLFPNILSFSEYSLIPNILTFRQLMDRLLAICGELGSVSDGCSALVTVNIDTIYDFLANNLQPEQVCSLFGKLENIASFRWLVV